MLPYSNLKGMKDLKIWIARSGHMSKNSVSLLYAFLHLFVIFLMWGLNERLLSTIITNILWLETLLRDTPFMVSGLEG